MSMYDQVWRVTYNNTSSNVEVINRNGVSNSCNFEFGLKKYIEYICLNNIHPNDRKNFLEYFSDVNMSKLFAAKVLVLKRAPANRTANTLGICICGKYSR